MDFQGAKTQPGGGHSEAAREPEEKRREPLPKEKPKIAKIKPPVDVERQCGVIMPSGQQCRRNLACSTHSVGAKRAVPGRSLPYDQLLHASRAKH